MVDLQLVGVRETRRGRDLVLPIGLHQVAGDTAEQQCRPISRTNLCFPDSAEDTDAASPVFSDVVVDDLWCRAPVNQDAMPPILHDHRVPDGSAAMVGQVQPAPPRAPHDAVAEGWRGLPPPDDDAALDAASFDGRLAEHDVHTTAPHLLVAAPEGDVSDVGVLAGTETLHAEAREDQRALPAGRLDDDAALAAAIEPQDVAVLRDTDALGIDTRPDEHETSALRRGGTVPLPRQSIDGRVDRGHLIGNDDDTGEAPDVLRPREFPANCGH
mmetsp:Transcript_84483/g.243917  ORF Transcript_84483/g.243917 Transcript_84483/m.243917 type:complete len:271 (+) Transcript_84483:135-947(+)